MGSKHHFSPIFVNFDLFAEKCHVFRIFRRFRRHNRIFRADWSPWSPSPLYGDTVLLTLVGPSSRNFSREKGCFCYMKSVNDAMQLSQYTYYETELLERGPGP